MNQVSTDLIILGWKGLVGIIAGSSVLTTILSKMFDAYFGERAKLLAQFHNLNKLIEQTERLTTTTESIRADIQHKVGRRKRL